MVPLEDLPSGDVEENTTKCVGRLLLPGEQEVIVLSRNRLV